jgi:predicted membrane protein
MGGWALNFWDFTIFFDGWWTLFIIVPCAVSMMQNGFNMGSAFGFILGVMLLLDAQSVLPFDLTWSLLFPAILVWIGLTIIFGGAFRRKNGDGATVTSSNDIFKNSSVFGSTATVYDRERFYGANLFCLFGGDELNLRNALVEENVSIKSTVIFGGTDILVPDDVNVKITSTSVLGGVDDQTKHRGYDKSKPTVFINCVCVFGGAEVK